MKHAYLSVKVTLLLGTLALAVVSMVPTKLGARTLTPEEARIQMLMEEGCKGSGDCGTTPAGTKLVGKYVVSDELQ